MELVTQLGLFLILFGAIVIVSKYIIGKNTKHQIDKIDDNIPSYFKNHTWWMIRLIVILILIIILWVTMSETP